MLSVKKGFSLIELMVIMGVAAVIFILGITGFSFVRQQGRDTERKAILAELANEINKYRVVHLFLPKSSDVSFNKDGFYIKGSKVYEFEKYLKAVDTSSSFDKTKYFYTRSGGGFILCAELESGSIASSGTVECPKNLSQDQN